MENKKETPNKKRLGRGIGSLLGGSTSGLDMANDSQLNRVPSTENTYLQKMDALGSKAGPEDQNLRIWQISIDKLVPGVFQPRRNFEKESLEELAQSIRENGILQPLTIRKRGAGGYEIIAGERRWRAAQMASLHEVPAIIKDVTDKDALQLAIIENVQREDLDAIEEAEAYQRLMQEFSYSQQQVAEKVGKERSTVANSLRLIALPNELKEMVSSKVLSTGHAKVILSVTPRAEQLRLARTVIDKQLSVRALENLIKGQTAVEGVEPKNSGGPLKEDLSQRLANELSEQLQKTLGTKVQINYNKGKGNLIIHFYSDEQLNSIYEKVNDQQR